MDTAANYRNEITQISDLVWFDPEAVLVYVAIRQEADVNK